VLSGWEPELVVLKEALAREPGLARRVVARPAGVGLVEAGIGAARAIAEVKPRAVIFVGTAGVYPPSSLPAGAAVVARRVSLASSAVLRGEAYLPSVLPASAESDAGLRRALALPVVDVVCPLAITRSRPAARRLANSGAVENLEAFAVARAASPLPFAAVLGVSNVVGPRAHVEWRRHAARASAAACQAVLAWLREPTPRARRGP
jgi:nucleoside phosphorylase